MACAACLLTAACASAPPGTSTRLPTGDYQGTLAVGGRSFLTTLRLRPDGATAVRGLLQVVSPVTIEGRVTGRVVDDLLRITVAYRGADGCESRIEGILDVIDEAARLDGPVMVSDCGDPIAGRLRVER